jgi:hypothetical protein
MFDFLEILQGASQVILHVICPKSSVHTGLFSEIFYAELTHQNSGNTYAAHISLLVRMGCTIGHPILVGRASSKSA